MPHVNILSLTIALLGAIHVQGICIGPPVNTATLDLVRSFEDWYEDICMDPFTREQYLPYAISNM